MSLFVNANVITADGGYDLDPKWAPGPYERQPAADGTPFANCAVTLPGPGTEVHGVSVASLPRDAVSLYPARTGGFGVAITCAEERNSRPWVGKEPRAY